MEPREILAREVFTYQVAAADEWGESNRFEDDKAYMREMADAQLAALESAGYEVTQRMDGDERRLAMKLALREHMPMLSEKQRDWIIAVVLEVVST